MLYWMMFLQSEESCIFCGVKWHKRIHHFVINSCWMNWWGFENPQAPNVVAVAVTCCFIAATGRPAMSAFSSFSWNPEENLYVMHLVFDFDAFTNLQLVKVQK